jgi:glycosyltransferase EpsF
LKAPAKVLHIVHSLGMGGAETWLMELLRLRARDGTAGMDFLMTSGDRGIFDDEAIRLGATIHYLRYGRADLLQFATRFRRILRDGQYDAIHDHSDYVSGWHFLIGAGVSSPIRVTHVHNPWLHIEANYAVSVSRRLTTLMGKRLVNLLATHVCGTSAEILRRYGFRVQNAGRPAVSVVHCGFDIAKFNAPREIDRKSVLREFQWPENVKVVLFAGRLDRALKFDDPQNHKNSWFALNVVRAAVRLDPSVRLLMAGTGDSRGELERHAREWGLEDNLRLIGVRSDMPRLMRAADVLLFPSRQEGLGMVAVEAQTAGLPVLASTAVPRESIVIGDLFDALPLSESVDMWAGALLRRIAKPRPSLDCCRRALASSPYSITNSAARLESVYQTAAYAAR